MVDSSRGWILTNALVVGRSPGMLGMAFSDSDYVEARRGFEVETVSSGDEANQKVKAAPYQYAVAIVDYKMDSGRMTSTSY